MGNPSPCSLEAAPKLCTEVSSCSEWLGGKIASHLWKKGLFTLLCEGREASHPRATLVFLESTWVLSQQNTTPHRSPPPDHGWSRAGRALALTRGKGGHSKQEIRMGD